MSARFPTLVTSLLVTAQPIFPGEGCSQPCATSNQSDSASAVFVPSLNLKRKRTLIQWLHLTGPKTSELWRAVFLRGCAHRESSWRHTESENLKLSIYPSLTWEPYHTCTGSSSTLTCPAISSISRARWQIDLAWCVHGSGKPLTVMYLSPTVSTWLKKIKN